MQHERVRQRGYTGTIYLPTYIYLHLQLSNYLRIYLPFSRQKALRPCFGERFTLSGLLNEAPIFIYGVSKGEDAVRFANN